MKIIIFTYTFFITGLLVFILSGCNSVVAKYKLKHPNHELILLTNGEVKTVPPSIMEREGYQKWVIDEDGVVDIVSLQKTSSESYEKKEFRQHLYLLLIGNKNLRTYKDRRALGMEVTSPSHFAIEIRKTKDKLTFSDMTLSQLKEKLPEMNKEGISLRFMPASNVRMNDIYSLLTVLNNMGYKRAFVEIYKKEGQEIKSRVFQIDFEYWNKSLDGTVFRKDGKEFFRDLK